MEKTEEIEDWEETKLIECYDCHKPLNGKTLYVTYETDENDPKPLCLRCAAKSKLELNRNWISAGCIGLKL